MNINFPSSRKTPNSTNNFRHSVPVPGRRKTSRAMNNSAPPARIHTYIELPKNRGRSWRNYRGSGEALHIHTRIMRDVERPARAWHLSSYKARNSTVYTFSGDSEFDSGKSKCGWMRGCAVWLGLLSCCCEPMWLELWVLLEIRLVV